MKLQDILYIPHQIRCSFSLITQLFVSSIRLKARLGTDAERCPGYLFLSSEALQFKGKTYLYTNTIEISASYFEMAGGIRFVVSMKFCNQVTPERELLVTTSPTRFPTHLTIPL